MLGLPRIRCSCSVHEPVGSTLPRFLLDAHPDLACPPETRLPAALAQLATLWSATEALPLSADDGNETAEIPEAAVAGIRHHGSDDRR
jgi:hypothetical protein